MKYKIEQRISTIAQNALMNAGQVGSFEISNIKFSHWDFNHRDAWIGDAWLGETEIDAANMLDALNVFSRRMDKVVSRISLITQSYIEHTNESFLIHRIDSEIAFFRGIIEVSGGGLMFMESHQKALEKLMDDISIPNEFYYYWNDATNAVGYPAKLLLMFSAIEALVRKQGEKDIMLQEEILGKDLSDRIFIPNAGIRHRLVHGEYFGENDRDHNYLELVHNKVVSYFNRKILKEELIDEGIVAPQRHKFGNKNGGNSFVQSNTDLNDLNLKMVLGALNTSGMFDEEKYTRVYDKKLTTNY